MGLTVLDVIEMTRSQYLQPGGVNQETWDVMTADITADATGMTLEGLADSFPKAAMVEWDDNTMEAALLKEPVGTVVDFQQRGYLDTEPAAHAEGTRVVLDSVYLKKTIFDALRSVIAQLAGFSLYQIVPVTGLTYVTSTLPVLPAGTIGIHGDAYVANGTTYNVLTAATSFRFLGNFTPPRIQFLGGGILGGAVTMNVKKDYTQPDVLFAADTGSPREYQTVLDVDLDDCGIPTSLQLNLPMGMASVVLSGRDIPQVDAEHVRRAQANAGIPVGTRVNLARTLWTQFASGPVKAEQVRLLSQSPQTIVHERF